MFRLTTVANFEVNWQVDNKALITVDRKSQDEEVIYKDKTICLDTKQ
ncbi:hypothetical protein [Niallia taxi]